MAGRSTIRGSARLPDPAPKFPLSGKGAQFSRLPGPARLLLVAGALLALICLFFAEENWRGRRAWEICRGELKAKGVELEWQKFVPAPVPNEQNFAETPFLAPLFDFNPKPRAPGQTIWRDKPGHDRAAEFGAALLPSNNQGQIPSPQVAGKMTDLGEVCSLLQSQGSRAAGLKNAFATRAEAARSVLTALDDYNPVLNELRGASRRPHSRFNIDYEAEDPISILLPHYLVLHRICRVLEVRASAELALQKTEAAFEALQLMLYLAGSTRGEPFVMSVISRSSLLKRGEQIIWEGLASRRWTEPQLKELERELKSQLVLQDLEQSLMAERAAFGEKAFRYIRSHKNALRSWIASSDDAGGVMYLLAGPSGWFFQEQVSYQELFGARVLAGFEASRGRVHPHVIDENQKALENELQHSAFWQHRGFSKLMLGQITKSIQRCAIEQNRVDQALIACALERYRVAHGSFPETLEALEPTLSGPLPLDDCTGRPQKYRLLPNGRFVLYGLGWNESDDGGVEAMKQDGADKDPEKGDWVWPQYTEP
jgi:hypothetical protein